MRAPPPRPLFLSAPKKRSERKGDNKDPAGARERDGFFFSRPLTGTVARKRRGEVSNIQRGVEKPRA